MINHGIATDSDSRSVLKRRRGWFYDAEKVARLEREREAQALSEWDRMDPARFGLCYFIGCTEGMVKIGYSKDVSRRLNELKGPSPFKLSIFATAKGGKERERHYHRRFADHALGNEWFELCPAIEAEIALLNGGAS